MTTFAVIKTGGKQYIVHEGLELEIEKLEHEGDKVVFDEVLLVASEKKAVVGQPLVEGATVTATVVAEGKGEKKMVFRYKSKVRYKKKKGHRQSFTKVKIGKISAK
ncbi:MAG: 50S ribosomal protein L21 [Candidatus Yanofskybacteria bacterium]|nr:50S ribosomal protein L21 [Candidatus Yanofskybacteria bacterium]